MWFAPLPVLLLSTATNRKGAAIVAFASMAIGMCNLWGYLDVLGLPVAVRILVLLPQAGLFAIATLVFREFLIRGAPWRAFTAFPASWVLLEWLQSALSPHGTFASLSYSQLQFLPFLQCAALTGPWGMSFLLMLFSSGIAVCVHQYKSAFRTSLAIAVVVSISIGSVVSWGVYRLRQVSSAHTVSVGLIASDGSNMNTLEPGRATKQLFTEYIEQAQSLVNQGATVVVLPEKLGVVIDEQQNTADQVFQPFVNRTQSVLVVGMVSIRGQSKFNEARVYRPELPVLRYVKQHMLPPFESHLTPGTSLTKFVTRSGIWGVAICKDMDFNDPSRGYGNAGVGLLLVPAWDFQRDWVLHGHMAIMRGVESGFAIARSAKGGSMYVSDNRGRVLAEKMSDAAPFSTLIVHVPVTSEVTLYRRWGDWFVWLVALCLLVAAVSLIKTQRAK
jgi:apolipoprotein N-acyltransferase